MLETTPESQRRDAAAATVKELIEDRDWGTLADLVDEWDAAGAYAAGDEPLSVHALMTATWAFADGYFEPNYCTPVPIPIIAQDAFDTMAEARKAHPGSHFLACLEANLYLIVAWEYRGTGSIDEVDDSGWSKAEQYEARSRQAVRTLMHNGITSAMLGVLRIGWLACRAGSGAGTSKATYARNVCFWGKTGPWPMSGPS